MVEAIRGWVKSAFDWCWSALLRAVSPSTRAVAVSPVTSSELPLGPSCRFKLSSVVTGAPVDPVDAMSADIRQFLDQRRLAFARGEFFRPLEHAANSGAVIVAHITERGSVNAEHFLAVYPAHQ